MIIIGGFVDPVPDCIILTSIEIVLICILKKNFKAVSLILICCVSQNCEISLVFHLQEIQRFFLNFQKLKQALVVLIGYKLEDAESFSTLDVHARWVVVKVAIALLKAWNVRNVHLTEIIRMIWVLIVYTEITSLGLDRHQWFVSPQILIHVCTHSLSKVILSLSGDMLVEGKAWCWSVKSLLIVANCICSGHSFLGILQQWTVNFCTYEIQLLLLLLINLMFKLLHLFPTFFSLFKNLGLRVTKIALFILLNINIASNELHFWVKIESLTTLDGTAVG